MSASQSIHVVVAFTKLEDEDGTIVAEPPVQLPSAHMATTRAKFLAGKHAGVIAWSRTVDPDAGDYGNPVELVRLGAIPEWFDETGDAGG